MAAQGGSYMMQLAVLASRLFHGLLLAGLFSGTAAAWMYTEGQGAASHLAWSVASDGAGNIIAGGQACPQGDCEALVVKLDGVTGEVLWHWPGPTDPPESFATTKVAVDSAGDVFVGEIPVVVKLAGTDGTELWRRSVGGSAVVVDTAGDVYAVSGSVIKLSGADGTTIWNATGDFPHAIAVDTNGDVFAGALNGNLTKFDGSSGAQLWRTDVSFEVGKRITVDGAGDVIAGRYKVLGTDGTLLWTMFNMHATAVDSAGDVFVVPEFSSVFDVRKLSGVDGTTIWARTLSGFGDADRVAVNAADDVVVVGYISGSGLVVTKYRGADGTQLWWRNMADGGATEFVLTAEDDAVIAGVSAGPRFLVAKMTGPSPGTKLVVRDKDGDPARRRLVVTVRDPALLIAPPGSPGDPTIRGATVTLMNPTSGETGIMMLPAEHWEGRGDPPGTKGYQYKDVSQSAGPCRKAKLSSRRLLKIDCKGADIPFSLDEPSGQGELHVRLETGVETLRHCVAFGGDIKRDVPAEAGGSGLFKARRATPPSSCGEGIGSPGAAFLHPAGTLFGW